MGRHGAGPRQAHRRLDLVWQTQRVSAPMVAEELARVDPPLVLDIRNPREWATRHIADSVNIPLKSPAGAHRRNSPRLPPGGALRGRLPSSIAASILHQYGITHVLEMAGGLAAWEAAQLPVVAQA